jgi:hypothetical protein
MFDINNISKYYNKEDDKKELINSTILEILEKISCLENENYDSAMEDLAIHARNIRNNFTDLTKKIDEVLPYVLLKSEIKSDTEILPRKKVLLLKINKKNKKSVKSKQ